MSSFSRFNPKAGAADFWHEFRKPNPLRWPILVASTLPLALIFYWVSTETVYKTPERPRITYITTFDPTRSDAEIAASNRENQEVKELREQAEAELAARKRAIYKALGKGIGMDVDRIAAEADARRAAEEAAEARALAERRARRDDAGASEGAVDAARESSAS
ncbi:MAG: hypothetical protein V2I27_11255 [Erythrobacter sp.]|jgi:hypothetical protein|nr:hypothetical protein [Erythrobacter sp.]